MFGFPANPALQPTIPVQQAMGFPTQKPVDYLPPRPPGLMQRISSFLTPERLRIIGAGLRDLGTGGNSLPDLLQQLDAERARLDEERWRRVQMEQAVRQTKRQDQQQEAVDNMISSLPPEQQPVARAAPQAFLTRRVEQMLPDQPEWQAGYDHAYRINPDGTTTIGGAIPHAPRASGGSLILGGSPNQDTVGFLADYIQQNGAPPTGAFARQPALARAVYDELARRRAGGDRSADPGRIGVAGASYAANRQGLGRLITQRSLVQSFERTARSNLQLAQRLSREVPRSDWPLINRALLTGQIQTGNTATARYINALIGARTEYAKVLSGATGAQGLTDSARHEAEEMFSQYASPEMIDGLVDVAGQEMDNRIRAFDDQEAYIRGQISGEGGEGETETRDNHARVGGRPMSGNNRTGGVTRYDANGRRIQ